MKTYNFAISIALICALLISCDSDTDTTNETQEGIAETEQRMNEGQEDLQEEYNTFREGANDQIQANEERINELKQEMENAEGDVRQRNQERINELEQKNDSLQTELEGYQIDTQEDWESFKEDFNSTLNEVGNSIEELFSDENPN